MAFPTLYAYIFPSKDGVHCTIAASVPKRRDIIAKVLLGRWSMDETTRDRLESAIGLLCLLAEDKAFDRGYNSRSDEVREEKARARKRKRNKEV